MATLFAMKEVFSAKEFKASNTPYELSPIPGPVTKSKTSWVTTLLGVRKVPELGILTTAMAALADRAIIHRSWGQLGGNSNYGPNFSFSGYSTAPNYRRGALVHLGWTSLRILVSIPPLRWVAKKLVIQPGDGPSEEDSEKARFQFRAIATPDLEAPTSTKAFLKISYEGSPYICKFYLL
jgi:hypothetical protein